MPPMLHPTFPLVFLRMRLSKVWITTIFVLLGAEMLREQVPYNLTYNSSTSVDKKEFKDILKALNDSIDQDTSNVMFLIMRGKLFHKAGYNRKAEKDFDLACQRDPMNTEARIARGMFLCALGKHDNALLDASWAYYNATDADEIARARIIRAHVFRAEGHPKIAVLELDKALEADSLNLSGLHEMALTLYQLKKYQQAIPYLQKAINKSPYDPSLYSNTGYLYILIGHYYEAINYFSKALDIDQEDPVALANRGFAEYKLGEYKKSLDDLNRSLRTQPVNGEGCYHRALVYLKLKEYRKAGHDFKKVSKYGASDDILKDAQILEDEYCN